MAEERPEMPCWGAFHCSQCLTRMRKWSANASWDCSLCRKTTTSLTWTLPAYTWPSSYNTFQLYCTWPALPCEAMTTDMCTRHTLSICIFLVYMKNGSVNHFGCIIVCIITFLQWGYTMNLELITSLHVAKTWLAIFGIFCIYIVEEFLTTHGVNWDHYHLVDLWWSLGWGKICECPVKFMRKTKVKE